MSDHMPAPFSVRRAAFGVLADAAAALGRDARMILTHPPDGVIRAVRRLRLSVEAVMVAAVAHERARGVTWEHIAADLGESVEFTREHYGPLVEGHRDDTRTYHTS